MIFDPLEKHHSQDLRSDFMYSDGKCVKVSEEPVLLCFQGQMLVSFDQTTWSYTAEVRHRLTHAVRTSNLTRVLFLIRFYDEATNTVIDITDICVELATLQHVVQNLSALVLINAAVYFVPFSCFSLSWLRIRPLKMATICLRKVG